MFPHSLVDVAEEADMRRAGIFRAGHVVILADFNLSSLEGLSSTAVASIEALGDADAIFAFQVCSKRSA